MMYQEIIQVAALSSLLTLALVVVLWWGGEAAPELVPPPPLTPLPEGARRQGDSRRRGSERGAG